MPGMPDRAHRPVGRVIDPPSFLELSKRLQKLQRQMQDIVQLQFTNTQDSQDAFGDLEKRALERFHEAERSAQSSLDPRNRHERRKAKKQKKPARRRY